jgi:hypothetical protein
MSGTQIRRGSEIWYSLDFQWFIIDHSWVSYYRTIQLLEVTNETTIKPLSTSIFFIFVRKSNGRNKIAAKNGQTI